ncbi:MAG: ABC transporter [Treponema sp. CETP13]|nr:MAG: ABC transporter [Treponema sp. CETP13]
METTEKNLTTGFFTTYFSKPLSYFIFILWALITVFPLFWMGMSSFKTNEELNISKFSLPYALFHNKEDVFVSVKPQLNITYPKGLLDKYGLKSSNIEKIEENIIILESTTIAPGRRFKVHFMERSVLKDLGADDIASMEPGDTIKLKELPAKYARNFSWNTIFWNYSSSWKRGGLGLKFLNSLLYTIVSTFFIVFLGLMLGYGISKFRYKKISAIILSIIGLGYLLDVSQIIIPLFLLLTKANLADTHIGIILVYIAFGLPLSVMLSSGFIKGLPDSLIESAYIDGATAFRTFQSIIVPMTIPVIVTICVMTGLGIWNEFLLVLVLASSEATKSLPVGIFSFASRQGTQLGWQIASLVIATLPVILVYLGFQKQLSEGVAGGAIKG